jgi:hypothetical protein
VNLLDPVRVFAPPATEVPSGGEGSSPVLLLQLLGNFGPSELAVGHQQLPSSRPTPPRSTSITTTGPSFTVSLDAEGAVDLRLIA